MDEINKLIKEIEDKDIENSEFEIEQNELQEDVRQMEKCIGQKVKILRRHLNFSRILKHYINEGSS